MNPAEATREICWNIDSAWLMYVLLAPTAFIAGYGFWRRFRLWRCGQPVVRWDRPVLRLGLFLREAVAQARTLRETFAGGFHFSIYAGFVILTAATAVVMLDYDFQTNIMRGPFYLYFQSLAVDIFGGLLMIGVAMAALRRWIKRPARLVLTGEASWILIAILAIAATGFLVEGLRIRATGDPWAAWSPIGNLMALASGRVLGAETLELAHEGLWWLHLVLAFGFLAWAPYTKLAHVVTGPLNIFTANLDGHGRSLKRIDFEADDEVFGVNDLARFTWKDLLDLDACTECGRCTAECPANTAGKSLSPRDMILGLRELMHARSRDLLGGNGAIDPRTAIADEALWACTTCAACMEACPVYIEQLPKIVDMRRYLVMEEGELPQTTAEVITSLEQRGHPFPGAQFSRVDWAEGLNIPVMAELDNPATVDTLLWVGCAGALLERNHSVVRSVALLLQRAGVSFAILGREERCTGDPARRMGNEFLFKTMAEKNIALLGKYGVEKILTPCPHCFNTFRNDYPGLGGRYEVEHHSTFLARLVAGGRLRLSSRIERKLTFHDPCYLGRYNGVFEEPRTLIRTSTGAPVAEMARNRQAGFCCGGGGGLSFADEPPAQRVNQVRARQAVATGADIVGVACPFCMTMLEDGIKASEGGRAVEVKDVAELLWQSVGCGKETLWI